MPPPQKRARVVRECLCLLFLFSLSSEFLQGVRLTASRSLRRTLEGNKRHVEAMCGAAKAKNAIAQEVLSLAEATEAHLQEVVTRVLRW